MTRRLRAKIILPAANRTVLRSPALSTDNRIAEDVTMKAAVYDFTSHPRVMHSREVTGLKVARDEALIEDISVES